MGKPRPVHSEGILARICESTNHYVVTGYLEEEKKYLVGATPKLNRLILSSAPIPSPSACTDTMAPRGLHLTRIRLKQEGFPVPGTQQREHRRRECR